MCGVAYQRSGSMVMVQRVVGDLVLAGGLQIQLFEDRVVVRGDEDLYAEPLQLEQNFDHRPEELRIQVRLRLVPEQHRPLKQRTVLDQQPEQAELAQPFRQQRELKPPARAGQEELLVLQSDSAFQNPPQFFENTAALGIRGAEQGRKIGTIQDVAIDLLEMDAPFRIQRTKSRRIRQHFLDGDVNRTHFRTRPLPAKNLCRLR